MKTLSDKEKIKLLTDFVRSITKAEDSVFPGWKREAYDVLNKVNGTYEPPTELKSDIDWQDLY